jgi:hypothetical protein
MFASNLAWNVQRELDPCDSLEFAVGMKHYFPQYHHAYQEKTTTIEEGFRWLPLWMVSIRTAEALPGDDSNGHRDTSSDEDAEVVSSTSQQHKMGMLHGHRGRRSKDHNEAELRFEKGSTQQVEVVHQDMSVACVGTWEGKLVYCESLLEMESFETILLVELHPFSLLLPSRRAFWRQF